MHARWDFCWIDVDSTDFSIYSISFKKRNPGFDSTFLKIEKRYNKTNFSAWYSFIWYIVRSYLAMDCCTALNFVKHFKIVLSTFTDLACLVHSLTKYFFFNFSCHIEFKFLYYQIFEFDTNIIQILVWIIGNTYRKDKILKQSWNVNTPNRHRPILPLSKMALLLGPQGGHIYHLDILAFPTTKEDFSNIWLKFDHWLWSNRWNKYFFLCPPLPSHGPNWATPWTVMDNLYSSLKKESKQYTQYNLMVPLLDLEKMFKIYSVSPWGPSPRSPRAPMRATSTISTTLNPQPLRMILAKYG